MRPFFILMHKWTEIRVLVHNNSQDDVVID